MRHPSWAWDYPPHPSIPQAIVEGLENYVRDGQNVGHFLTAVLENNLTQAVFRADDGCLYSLIHICRLVYNELPGNSWGSPEKVTAWQRHLGLRGLDEKWKELSHEQLEKELEAQDDEA